MEWVHLLWHNYFTLMHLVFVHSNYGSECFCTLAAQWVKKNYIKKFVCLCAYPKRLIIVLHAIKSQLLFQFLVVYMLHKNLEPIILIGLPVYTFLLVTMSWRAISIAFRSNNKNDLLKINCATSSLLFVISDTLIAIDKFYRPISNSTFWIMTTYYIAQFGITLSVVDAQRGLDRVSVQKQK